MNKFWSFGVNIHVLKGLDNIFIRVFLLGKGVLIYLEVVTILVAHFEDLVKVLKEVYTLLHGIVLSLKLQKCNFFKVINKYLDAKITPDRIKTDFEKAEAMTSTSSLKYSKQVSKFLCIVSWFFKFIARL